MIGSSADKFITSGTTDYSIITETSPPEPSGDLKFLECSHGPSVTRPGGLITEPRSQAVGTPGVSRVPVPVTPAGVAESRVISPKLYSSLVS
eukprot:220297-Hanusia_phi.AAC.1